eukprot:TRINITY_DN67982_c0_g1_i1.p1 TRINITY_DN67982_c0_g1~~TRINITY_DN67982_c0_g1_i1.p1  ORF type:complete len:406 (-),score=64.07 TRINITY_DN67982_c0_g1_i1:188-1405(-)
MQHATAGMIFAYCGVVSYLRLVTPAEATLGTWRGGLRSREIVDVVGAALGPSTNASASPGPAPALAPATAPIPQSPLDENRSVNASTTPTENVSENVSDMIRHLANVTSASTFPAAAPSSLASTVTTANTSAGTRKLEIKSSWGFDFGDTIKIGKEIRQVVGFGSLILDKPLENEHPVGTVVEVVAKAKVNHNFLPKDLTDPNREKSIAERAIEAAGPGFGDLDCIDRDNFITVHEAATFGMKNGIPWSEIEPIFKVVDMDKDNRISRKEFDEGHPVSKAILEDLRAGFRDIDLDNNNLIDVQEWMLYCDGWMVPRPSTATCEELFEAADLSEPTGRLDHSEFDKGGKRSGFLVAVHVRGRLADGRIDSTRGVTSTSVNARQLLGSVCRRHRGFSLGKLVVARQQ